MTNEQVALKTLTLHDRALAAYNAVLAENEAIRAKNRQEDTEWIKKDLTSLGVDPSVMTVDGDCVIVEGMRFGRVHDHIGYDLVMRGPCPKCGEETRSGLINSLSDIGKLINHYAPAGSHVCKTEPSLSDQVEAAYRWLIEERVDLEHAIEKVRQAKYELEAQEAYAWKKSWCRDRTTRSASSGYGKT